MKPSELISNTIHYLNRLTSDKKLIGLKSYAKNLLQQKKENHDN